MIERKCDFCGKRLELQADSVGFSRSFSIVRRHFGSEYILNFDACDECEQVIINTITNMMPKEVSE